jgi:hypothetical protein
VLRTASSIGPLRENLDGYQDLFHHLGFRLVVHQRDFFYFRGKDSLSPQASRMAVFVFILIESLADQGEPVVDTLMTRTFSIPDLPHLKGARYRAYLKEAGASGEDELRDCSATRTVRFHSAPHRGQLHFSNPGLSLFRCLHRYPQPG